MILARVAALALVLAAAAMARRLGADQELESGAIAMGLGLALIASALAGELFERLRLPRVTGYLLFGLLCGPYAANLISRPMARELQIINGLAVALIAFIAGLELNLASLKPRVGTLLQVGTTILAVVYIGSFLAIAAAWPWLPILPEADWPTRLVLAWLLSSVVASFSPTVTLAVIAESRARGPLSELAMALVVLGDLALIVVFTLAMQATRWMFGTHAEGGPLAVRLAWEIFGSFAFGALAGGLFALFLRFVAREVTLALLGLCVLLSVIGRTLDFEPLLAALAAGIVVENVMAPRGTALREAVERGALPVFVLFFAAAGASLDVQALQVIGLPAVLIASWRALLIFGGARWAGRRSGVPFEIGRRIWQCLVSQAGVTLGLAVLVGTEFSQFGAAFQTLIVALVALHELVGPVLLRNALSRVGEAGRADVDRADAVQAGDLSGAVAR